MSAILMLVLPALLQFPDLVYIVPPSHANEVSPQLPDFGGSEIPAPSPPPITGDLWVWPCVYL